MTNEEIKRKLINDPEWEPTPFDIKKDPDVWTKMDEVLEEMHGAPLESMEDIENNRKKKSGDEFDDLFGEETSEEIAPDLNFAEEDLY